MNPATLGLLVAAIALAASTYVAAEAHRWDGSGVAPDILKSTARNWLNGHATDAQFFDQVTALHASGILKFPKITELEHEIWTQGNLTAIAAYERDYWQTAYSRDVPVMSLKLAEFGISTDTSTGPVVLSASTATVTLSADCPIGKSFCMRPDTLDLKAPASVQWRVPANAHEPDFLIQGGQPGSPDGVSGYASHAEPYIRAFNAPGTYHAFVLDSPDNAVITVRVSSST